ncbi:MAG: GntR family transcriptional regulator [Proteobacteria bacterium]|nr:GntR family transcriptional regulator [Pseudomonadota bacterium]MBS0492869.1 GntR family transcriptional regulator [Pseudomonadota bacterium]
MQPPLRRSHLDQFVRRSTAENAAAQLREAIIGGELPMGAPLSEMAIAEQLGISRTPVREAFRLLAQEGLVQLRPFAGANVFHLNRTELRQLSAFREMLETAATEEALKIPGTALVDALNKVVSQMRDALKAGDTRQYLELDSEFHETVMEGAQNPLLRDAYQIVASRFKALRTAVVNDPARLKRSLNSHAALVKLFSSRDTEAAKAALLRHVRGSEEMLEAQPSLLQDTK